MALAAGPAQESVSSLSSSIQYTDASSSICKKPAWAGPYRLLGDSRTYLLTL